MTFFRIEKKPFIASKKDYFVATRRKNGTICGEGAVIHPIGQDEVNISSYGHTSTHVVLRGRESLAHVRDSLIEICKMQGID